jgi:hypothetical protein
MIVEDELESSIVNYDVIKFRKLILAGLKKLCADCKIQTLLTQTTYLSVIVG